MEKSEQIALVCERHRDLMVDGLWNAYKAQKSVDLNLMEWGGQSLVAHQVVASIFFSLEKLMDGALTALPGEPKQIMANVELLLEFMYKGRVTVDQEKLDGLLDVARRLDFGILVDAGVAAKKSGTPVKEEAAKQTVETRGRKLSAKRSETKPEVGRRKRKALTSPVRGTTPLPAGGKKRFKIAVSEIKEEEDSDDPDVSIPSAAVDKPKVYLKETFECVHCPFTSADEDLVIGHVRDGHADKAGGRCSNGRTERSGAPLDDSSNGSDCWLASKPPARKRAVRKSGNLKSSDSTPTIHKCEHCNFSHIRKSQVDSHNRKVHLRIRPFICEVCGYAACGRPQLIQHKRRHTGERPYVCEMCGKAFTDQSTLIRHVRGHRAKDQTSNDVAAAFTCDICGFSSHRKDAFATHMRTVHAAYRKAARRTVHQVASAVPLGCRRCSFVCRSQAMMNRHVRQEHGPNVNAYSCDLCEYTGKSSVHVKKHRRIHTGEKPYSCPGCDSSFKDHSNYARHRARICREDAERPYGCTECGRAFVLQRYLKAHVDKAHSEDKDGDGLRAIVVEEGAVEHVALMMGDPQGGTEVDASQSGIVEVRVVHNDQSGVSVVHLVDGYA